MSIINDYYGQFIEYYPIHYKEEIYEFLKLDNIYSNLTDYKAKVNKLVEYESKRTSGSQNIIYAVSLRVMLPKHLNKSIKHELVKSFMLQVSPKMKDLLYLYHFKNIGKGDYVDIIIFERQIFKKKHFVYKKYKRDMWIDKTTGRTCGKDSPHAVHRCKKGDIVKDKKGNKVKTSVLISPKKYRYFNYKNGKESDDGIRKINFERMIHKLKKCFIKAMTKCTLNRFLYYTLQHKRFDIGNENTRMKIYMYNNTINRINLKLREVQNTFHIRGLYPERIESWKHFEKIFFSLRQILKNGFIRCDNVKIYIDPYENKDICELKYSLRVLERIANEKINGYLYEEFYDPMFDDLR